ncbi:MAG: Gfo/Idh/MocA family oxidoreductase [Thermoguttaceae bacterium]
MQSDVRSTGSRREFLKNTSRIAAASALAGVAIPACHAAENNTIQLALIGCGGRGTGAVANAMTVPGVPLKLVAMADVFQDRLTRSHASLQKKFDKRMDVPDDRKFVGLDAYRKAMDCLKPGDLVILATPLGFRSLHFGCAIEKGLHVFMEKPLTSDGPTSRRMLEQAEASEKKNLKVGVGLMSRHSRPMQEAARRIHDGAIGDIILLRGYRMHGPIGTMQLPPKPADVGEVEWQIRKFHGFLWASGGCYSDFYIHIIDHCCWMKNAWPVKAQSLGGRHYRNSPQGIPYVDQNFDVYSTEYTFADGTKFYMDGRCMLGCAQVYRSFAHGAKGTAVLSKTSDCGTPSSFYKGLDVKRADRTWESKTGAIDCFGPYVNEWIDLFDAIRNDKPYNETRRGVEASLVTSMGRMAAHTGVEVTFDDMLNCQHEMAPNLDQLTLDGPAPVKPDANGRYPIPQPGIVTKQEY